jgi:hypothetical protein
LTTITDDGAHPIEKGHVIYLDGSVDEIRERGTYKHRHWTTREIEELVSDIDDVYQNVEKTIVCTRGRTIAQVTKEVARAIFLCDYNEIDVRNLLASISKEGR